MTETTGVATAADLACWDCGGPCLTYKGSEHGWRCHRCCARYVAEGAARAVVDQAAQRAAQMAKLRRSIR